MASSNFINECKNSANSNRLGKLIVEDLTDPFTQSNKISSFEIDSGCYVDGNIIGTIYIKSLTGNLVDISNSTNLVGKDIEAEIGVKYSDNTTEYVDMGNYNIEKQTDTETSNECKITAYDNIYNKINSVYVCGLDYDNDSITLSDLYNDLCDNLDLTPNTLTFLNSTISISANPFKNNETNKTVLESIAKVACSFVTIDNTTDKIDLSWVSNSTNPDYTFQTSDYSTLEGGVIEYGPVNVVILKNSQIDSENVTMQDETSISQYGEHQIVISEDYILYNATLRQQAITAIYNRINGFKYVDSKLTCYYGKPFLKIGDKIRIYKDSTNYFDTYVLKHNFTYDGSFKSIIESPTLTEKEISTKQNISLGEALRNTQVIVNKQTGEISSLTNNVQNLDTRENNNYQHIISKFEDYTPESDFITLENSVTQLQTDTYTKTEINTKLIDGSVKKVLTTSGTFDENGMTYQKTNAPTKSTINEKGLLVQSTTGSGEELLFAGYDEDLNSSVVRTANINVTNYLVIGDNSRMENYEDGTGVFDI